MGKRYYYKMSTPFAIEMGYGDVYKLCQGDIIEHIEGDRYEHAKRVLVIKPERIAEFFRPMLEPEDAYWQSIRDHAAIAAMQAALSNQNLLEAIGQQGKKNGINSFENVLRFAISSARDLVEKLKEEE